MAKHRIPRFAALAMALSLSFTSAVYATEAEETEISVTSEKEEQPGTKNEQTTEKEPEKPVQSEEKTQSEPVKEPESETVKESEANTESEAKPEEKTEVKSEPGTEAETELPKESETEQPSEKEPESETASEAPTEPEVTTEPVVLTPEESIVTADEPTAEELEELTAEQELAEEVLAEMTNEELLAQQSIVIPDITVFYEEFRFSWKEDAQQAYLIKGGRIYEEPNEKARIAGRTFTGTICYVLAEEENGWCYVESGEVRGFVPAEELIGGDAFAAILESTPAEELWKAAECYLSPMENAALTYTMTTGSNPVAEKVYAVAAEELEIYDSVSADAVITGILPKDGLAYILCDADETFVYVESQDVRGFAEKAKLITGTEAEEMVQSVGEVKMKTAEEKLDPEQNSALYYTIRSVQKADENALLRQEIITCALQYVGNPYVWGGNSLTDGIDCSGFAQAIMKKFGYSIPRSSRSQSVYGQQIPVSAALPGDLIFYAKDGQVYHVGIYLGNDMIVNAAGAKSGIIVRSIGKNAVWATRVIQ